MSPPVVKLYQVFITRLISARLVVRLVAVVQDWMNSGLFDQSFVTMVSREDNFLTLNLVHLMNELPNDILKQLSFSKKNKSK